MITDIGPGGKMLIDKLEQDDDPDFFWAIELPYNGYTACVSRALPREGVPNAVTDTLFDMMLGNTPDEDPIDVATMMSPVDVVRKLRDWFLLPKA